MLICTFLLFGCNNSDVSKETTLTPETTTPIPTTSASQESLLIVTDPTNDYENNQLLFYFEEDLLKKIEYVIVFETLNDAMLGEELYLAYADQYDSIQRDNLTLIVEYGPDMRLPYEAISKDALKTSLISEGYIVIED